MTTRPAILYARFSPRRNAAECESIDTQLERLRAFCLANGYQVLSEHRDEGMSGAHAKNRPGLQDALSAACRHKAALMVYSLSRLARSTRDAIDIAERLDRSKADLVSLNEKIDTTTAMGRAFFKFIAVLAELERELIIERTRDAMLRHQANGRRMSDKTPYGWTRDPDNPALMVQDPGEQATVAAIVELRKQGLGLRAIGRHLEHAGCLCRGGRWHHGTIQAILDRAGAGQ